MKKIILFMFLLCGISYAQFQKIYVATDTTNLKAYDGSGIVLLDKYGAGDVTGGGLFHRIDSAYAEGSFAFDYNTLDGFQWARIGLIDPSPTLNSVTVNGDANVDSLINDGGGTFAGKITSTFSGKVFSAGSYSSKIALPTGATTEMSTIAGEGSEDDFYIGYGSYIRTTGEDGRGFGLATLVEATNTTGTSTLQGGQMMTFLGTVGGTEAAVLKSAGGDATAGMYNLWLKSGANDNVVLASGAKTANLWLDNSMSGNLTDNGAEVYSAYITAGGMKLDAVFGLESGTLGWSSLFYFDETAYSKDPVVSGDATAGSKDYHLKVDINGTIYGIQLYAL